MKKTNKKIIDLTQKVIKKIDKTNPLLKKIYHILNSQMNFEDKLSALVKLESEINLILAEDTFKFSEPKCKNCGRSFPSLKNHEAICTAKRYSHGYKGQGYSGNSGQGKLFIN